MTPANRKGVVSVEFIWDGPSTILQVLGGTAYGGGIPVVLGLCDATRRLGLMPVALATHPDVVEAFVRNGVDVWFVEGIDRAPQLIKDLRSAVRLAMALSAQDVGMIHTHTSKGGMVGRLAGWIARTPHIIHHTHSFYHSFMPPGIRRTMMMGLERLFARMCDVQVFVNQDELRQAVDGGIVKEDSARLIYNGIHDRSLPSRAEARLRLSELDIETDGLVVGTIARLDRDKAIDIGIQVFARAADASPGMRYVIIGSGEDLQRLEKVARSSSHPDEVVFLGHVDDASSLLPGIDIVLFPSRREGLSISLIEAAQASRPSVAVRIRGNVDIIEDGVTGFICPVDDVDCMADRVIRLAEDASLRAKIGNAAHERFADQFTYGTFIEAVIELYDDTRGKQAKTSRLFGRAPRPERGDGA